MAAVVIAAPAQAGVVVQGKVSWFGGPNDGMDSGKTALGLTTATPGVAIRPGATYMSGRKTLGGYWRITDPRTGKSVVLRQTDIGPNESTGRRIDLTYSALRKFGYSERNFPTDSTWKAEYLGKNKPTGSSRKVTQRRVPQGSRLGGAVTGVDPQERASLILQYARNRRRPGALLELAGGLKAQEAAAAQTVQETPSVSRSGGSSAPSGGSPLPGVGRTVSDLKNRANAIDRKRLPYLWGGGHGGRVNPYKAKPLDCSGAVSAVLGIDPRVSGQFTKWGKPGRGGKVTIYANGSHVFMEIDGHFFGTSKSNPGGGAGWIPRSAISASYLKGFTARHVG